MLPERRLHPRYFTTFPLRVKVENRNGVQEFTSETVNISKTAMEVQGDGAMVASFMAQTTYPHFCELAFTPPGGHDELVINCQLLTHRRLSQHCYHLVFLFGDFISGNPDALMQFLESQQGQEFSQAR